MRRALPLLLLPLAAACEGTPTVCALRADALSIAPGSVHVAVVDSVSGENLAPVASGRWIAGTATDTLHNWGNVLVAMGPAGRYSLAVEAPGYRPWARSDVEVRTGECGIQPAAVTARLQRP